MLKKIFLFFILFSVILGAPSALADVNEPMDVVPNPGGGGDLASASLSSGSTSDSSDWLKVIDGSSYINAKVTMGAVKVNIYFVYASGPDRLVKSYSLRSGESLNTNLNLTPATYRISISDATGRKYSSATAYMTN